MNKQLKQVLKGLGLFDPLKRVRQVMFPVSEEGRRVKFAKHARRLGFDLEYRADQILVRKLDRQIKIDSRHEVYLMDMVNFFDYYHGAVLPKMVDRIAVVDYSRPALQQLSRSGVEFEFPSLPESDESTEVYVVALDLQPGEVVFDLGAYAGASAYFLAKAVGPDGMVISFEPDELNFRYLQANIARHGLTNVRPVNKGIWSETANLEFQAEGNMGSSAVSITGRTSNVKTVPVISLEDAAKLSDGRRVGAIKMDIEGAEVEVLREAGEFLRKHRPRMVIEPHVVNGKMVTEELRQILAENAYQSELLRQGSQNWPLIAARPAVEMATK